MLNIQGLEYDVQRLLKKNDLKRIIKTLEEKKENYYKNLAYSTGLDGQGKREVIALNIAYATIKKHGEIFEDYEGKYSNSKDFNIANSLDIVKWGDEDFYRINFYNPNLSEIKVKINKMSEYKIDYTIVE